MLKDVECRNRFTDENTLLQPIPECVTGPGVLIALIGRVGRPILPKFKSDYVVGTLPMKEPLFFRRDNVIGRADNR